jgi:hypothetical protein
VKYAAPSEVEIARDAIDAFDKLRSAYTAVVERFAKWRRRHPKEGMPLKGSEPETVGEALRHADYIIDFDQRFPHRCDGAPCRVVHGDPELLAKPEVSLVVWEVVEPVLRPEDAEARAWVEARARRAAEAAEPPTAPPSDVAVSQPKPMTADEQRRKHARESFLARTDPASRWRGIDHAPNAEAEFKQARREGRVRFTSVEFLGSNKPRGRR